MQCRTTRSLVPGLAVALCAGVCPGQASFELYDGWHGVGMLGEPGFSCISGDGRVAAGWFWDDIGGFFGVLNGSAFTHNVAANWRFPEDISFDGRVIVEDDRLWTDGSSSALDAFAFAVSGDGRVLGGSDAMYPGFDASSAQLWIDGSRQSIGAPAGRANASVNGLSGDGSVAVGADLRPFDLFFTPQPCTAWRYEGGQFTPLQLLPGQMRGGATQVSADGGTVVGASSSADSPWTHITAVRWVNDQVQGLGAGERSIALDVSGDGSRIVGASDGLGAFVWTQSGGARPVSSIVEQSGYDLSGVHLEQATGISDDGLVIVGLARVPEPWNPGSGYTTFAAWRLTLEPSCMRADLGEPHGVLDASDIIAFLSGFAGDDPVVADLAPPRLTLDFADVIALLQAFGRGCP